MVCREAEAKRIHLSAMFECLRAAADDELQGVVARPEGGQTQRARETQPSGTKAREVRVENIADGRLDAAAQPWSNRPHVVKRGRRGAPIDQAPRVVAAHRAVAS